MLPSISIVNRKITNNLGHTLKLNQNYQEKSESPQIGTRTKNSYNIIIASKKDIKGCDFPLCLSKKNECTTINIENDAQKTISEKLMRELYIPTNYQKCKKIFNMLQSEKLGNQFCDANIQGTAINKQKKSVPRLQNKVNKNELGSIHSLQFQKKKNSVEENVIK